LRINCGAVAPLITSPLLSHWIETDVGSGNHIPSRNRLRVWPTNGDPRILGVGIHENVDSALWAAGLLTVPVDREPTDLGR
jgi:hypothetical protein